MKRLHIIYISILIFTMMLSSYTVYGETIGYTNISDIGIFQNKDYSSSLTDILKLNSKVEILTESDEWYKIKTEDGKTGWIEKYFINVPVTKFVRNKTLYNTNIRKGPTTGSEIAGQLRPGEKAEYIDTYHSWHIIEYNGSQYYIASWLTEIVSDGTENIYLLYDKINIRSDADLSSSVIAQGNKDDTYSVLGEKNGWLKIMLPEGKTGYVAGWLTSYDKNYYTEGAVDHKTTVENLNLRTGPSVSHSKIVTLPADTSVKVILTENGWDKVITENGRIGWCNSSYLAKSKPLAGKKILLDPGHGGKDPGAISYSGRYEKYINLEVAYKLKSNLENLGATVYMTRTGDTYINNTERGRMADKLGADILFSIHHNSLNNNDYFGLSTYYNSKNNKGAKYGYSLAESVYLSTTTINGVYRDGILDRNFEVLRETDTPAALIEIGFMSNPLEEMNIHNDSFQDLMAQKIAEGIADYFK